MANRHRGEIEAALDGKSYRLCLTLGALAELEHAFGEDDMLAVAERFEGGAAGFVDIVARLLAATFTAAREEAWDRPLETKAA
jgi:Phage tail tube protein, GTA-gp10